MHVVRLMVLCLLLAALPLPARAGTPAGSPPPSLLATASPSVFLVVAQDGSKDVLLGTAVAIQPEYLVTNQHVVADVLSLSVRQGDRGWVAFRAYTDREWNLALLHVPALRATPAEIGRSDMLQPGEMVYALSPGGREAVFAPAQVSAVQTVGGQRVLDVRVGAAHSRSAGGLFDPRGTLIGLSAYRIWGTEDTMRALAGESIAAALRRMRPVR